MEVEIEFKKNFTLEDFDVESWDLIRDYICSLCQGILYEPVLDKCQIQHFFCKICYERLVQMSQGQTICPISKNLIDPAQITWKVTFLENMLKNLKVFCKNKLKGCQWKERIDERKNHLQNECLEEEIKCINEGCNTLFLRKDLEKHLRECNFKKTNCENCSIELVLANIPEHLLLCPKILEQCSNMCEKRILREDMEKHLKEECELSYMSCYFYRIGCMERFIKVHKNEHLKAFANHHNLLMMNFIRDIQNSVKEKGDYLTQLYEDYKKKLLEIDVFFRKLNPLQKLSITTKGDNSKPNLPIIQTKFPTINKENIFEILETKSNTLFNTINNSQITKKKEQKNISRQQHQTIENTNILNTNIVNSLENDKMVVDFCEAKGTYNIKFRNYNSCSINY
jgi:TNF receptor-associated factor 4